MTHIVLGINLIHGPQNLQLVRNDQLESDLTEISVELNQGERLLFCKERPVNGNSKMKCIILEGSQIDCLILEVDEEGAFVIDHKGQNGYFKLDDCCLLSDEEGRLTDQHRLRFPCFDYSSGSEEEINSYELDVSISSVFP